MATRTLSSMFSGSPYAASKEFMSGEDREPLAIGVLVTCAKGTLVGGSSFFTFFDGIYATAPALDVFVVVDLSAPKAMSDRRLRGIRTSIASGLIRRSGGLCSSRFEWEEDEGVKMIDELVGNELSDDSIFTAPAGGCGGSVLWEKINQLSAFLKYRDVTFTNINDGSKGSALICNLFGA